MFFKVFGGFFLCFCRCRNYDDFLLQFTFQNAPKLILATLAPFGPSGGSLCGILFWGFFFIVLAGVQIMTIFSRSLSSKVLLNLFW